MSGSGVGEVLVNVTLSRPVQVPPVSSLVNDTVYAAVPGLRVASVRAALAGPAAGPTAVSTRAASTRVVPSGRNRIGCPFSGRAIDDHHRVPERGDIPRVDPAVASGEPARVGNASRARP